MDYFSETSLPRLVSSISILSSRANQPIPCMITSRGASMALTSLVNDMAPSLWSVCQMAPAVSPIWVVGKLIIESMAPQLLPWLHHIRPLQHMQPTVLRHGVSQIKPDGPYGTYRTYGTYE